MFGNFVNSNTYIANVYLTKSNLLSKCDFKSDEDKNKHWLALFDGIVEFRLTLLVYIPTE